MRKARDWFATGFHPESTQDILKVLVGDHSADFRMVVSYWDMAAAFVVFGAIKDEMFNAINTEHVVGLCQASAIPCRDSCDAGHSTLSLPKAS